MKTLFILPAFGKSVRTHLGIAQLSAVLREAGHRTALLKINRPISHGRFFRYLRQWPPEVAAFTCVTHHWPQVRRWAEWVKEFDSGIRVAVGGVHATLAPESVTACTAVDAVVLGEGEAAFAAILEAWENGGPKPDIPGTILRQAEGWKRTAPGPFRRNLDELPVPDRTLFDPEAGGDMPLMAGRGCPFECAYCCNHILKRAQGGPYVRMRSAEHVIAEICRETGRRPVRRLVFEDDTFTLRTDWLREFLPRYRDTIGLPFVCNARVGHFDAETAGMLKEAGCAYVSIGVEAGDERLRRETLGRDMSDAAIEETFRVAGEAGLDVYAFYMIGFPGETAAMARKTLALHERLRPKAGFQISVFYPYPRTRLWEIAERDGLLEEGGGKVGFEGGVSTLRLKAMTPGELKEIYDAFERLRLESAFGEGYVRTHYPWAVGPLRLAGALFGRARVLAWAKAARDRLAPAHWLRESTYRAEGWA